MNNEARIALLKRCARSLSQSWHKFPTEITRLDIIAIENWITELGGDARDSVHAAITEGKKRSE